MNERSHACPEDLSLKVLELSGSLLISVGLGTSKLHRCDAQRSQRRSTKYLTHACFPGMCSTTLSTNTMKEVPLRSMGFTSKDGHEPFHEPNFVKKLASLWFTN